MFRAFQPLTSSSVSVNFQTVGKTGSVLLEDLTFNTCFACLQLSCTLLSFDAKDNRVSLCCLRWIRTVKLENKIWLGFNKQKNKLDNFKTFPKFYLSCTLSLLNNNVGILIMLMLLFWIIFRDNL